MIQTQERFDLARKRRNTLADTESTRMFDWETELAFSRPNVAGFSLIVHSRVSINVYIYIYLARFYIILTMNPPTFTVLPCR